MKTVTLSVEFCLSTLKKKIRKKKVDHRDIKMTTSSPSTLELRGGGLAAGCCSFFSAKNCQERGGAFQKRVPPKSSSSSSSSFGRRRRRRHRKIVIIQNGFFDDVLKAVTPKEVFADASKEKALEREALIARAPKGTMKSAHALLANTVIDGEELTIAYDAREHGWTAKAFHERVDGKGPTLIMGKTVKGGRFAGYNPLGYFSVEDYRDCPSAFLCVFKDEQTFLNGDRSGMEILPNVGSPAIFDFGAQGPTFGVDGLRIPLGNAPRNGSSYAGVGDATTSYGSSKKCISRLGSHYASTRSDGITNVFAKGEKNETELKELVALVSPSMERDGLYVS